MYSKKITLKLIATFICVSLLANCSNEKAISNYANTHAQPFVLDVYKVATCGCCKKWINHINENGFQSQVYNVQNVSFIKEKNGIEPIYRSCHTAISKEGYVFEGHVPAKFIQQFLNEKHTDNVIGLVVPDMPIGSPGMEVGDKFNPYEVLRLKSDGSYDVYAVIQSYEEQF